MDVYLVFNELSLHSQYVEKPDVNEYTAQQWMEQFGDVITRAHRYGIKALRTGRGFFELLLVPGYSLRDWTTDRRIDRDLTRRIRSAATAYDELEYIQSEVIGEVDHKKLSFDFKHAGEAAEGLGFAFLLDSIAVSLATDKCWQENEVNLDIKEMLEVEDDIQFLSRTSRIKHVSHSEHIDAHRDWMQLERRATGIENGVDLLKKVEDWFPDLIIVDSARKQIEVMVAGTPQLRQFVNRLFELENYCRLWTTGGFDKEKVVSKVSPESASVRADTRLRSMRIFTLPDGREEFFEWHLRLTPDEWRLFFLPDATARKIYVGYIGRKLPTRKYRTI